MTISPHWPTRRSFVPDTIRAVGWAPPVAGVLLALATSGEKQPLTIRVQPDLPTYLGYTSASAQGRVVWGRMGTGGRAGSELAACRSGRREDPPEARSCPSTTMTRTSPSSGKSNRSPRALPEPE